MAPPRKMAPLESNHSERQSTNPQSGDSFVASLLQQPAAWHYGTGSTGPEAEKRKADDFCGDVSIIAEWLRSILLWSFGWKKWQAAVE